MPPQTRQNDARKKLSVSLKPHSIVRAIVKTKPPPFVRLRRASPRFAHMFDVLINDFGIDDLRDATTQRLVSDALTEVRPTPVRTSLHVFKEWLHAQSMRLQHTRVATASGNVLSKKRVAIHHRELLELCTRASYMFSVHFNPPLRLLVDMRVKTLKYVRPVPGAHEFVTLDRMRYRLTSSKAYAPTQIRPGARALVDLPLVAGDLYTFSDVSKYFSEIAYIAEVFNSSYHPRFRIKQAVVYTGVHRLDGAVENVIGFTGSLIGSHIRAITPRSGQDAHILVLTWMPPHSFIVKFDNEFTIRSVEGIFPHARINLRAIANAFSDAQTSALHTSLLVFVSSARTRCKGLMFL